MTAAEVWAANLRLAAALVLERWDAYHADESSVSPHDYFTGEEFELLRAALEALRADGKGGASC